MTTPDQKRQQLSIIERRAQAANMYLQGMPQGEIADALGVDAATISRDLTEKRADWIRSANMDMAEALGRQLETLDRVESEAWAAFEKSKEDGERMMSTVEAKAMTKAVKITITSAGDPRFLDTVVKVVAQRAALLGLLKVRLEHTGKDGEPITITADHLKVIQSQVRKYESDRQRLGDG